MALTPTGVYNALVANRLAGVFPFGGVAYDKLALGLALGVCQWGVNNPANLALKGVATGSAGVGKILPAASKIVLVSSGAVTAGLQGAGMVGPLSQALGTAVEAGLSQAFSSLAQYNGQSPTVAVGTDTSKVSVANAASLVGILNQTMGAVMGTGPAYGMMTAGLGNGVAALLLTGTGSGAVTGTPVVPAAPATGTTTSVVI